ncbi:O-antigen ligase family protein [Billgrantia lactosivorans]|uniref:O-antigen ligase family protein n=1 Tax=Billgrantia lactosivorans TaxID=2185141 RepID=UPI000DACEFBC|nr:O-antigen ligase family protein [Halomonas lactosivorans]
MYDQPKAGHFFGVRNMPFLLVVVTSAGLLSAWLPYQMMYFDLQRFLQLGAGLIVLSFSNYNVYELIVLAKAHISHCSALLVMAIFFIVVYCLVSFAPLVAILDAGALLFIALMIMHVFIHAARWKLILWLVGGGAITFVLWAYAFLSIDRLIIQYDHLVRSEMALGFSNIRQFSDVAVGLMPLGLLYIVSRSQPSFIAALLCFLPLSFWWYLLFLTEGRAGILSLTIAMTVALVLFGRAAQWPVATLFSSALAGLAGWWFVNPLRRGLENGEIFHRDIASDNNRFDLWRTAIQYGIDNFPFGIGPMQFAGDGRISYAHAHNLIFNTAAEWGIPIALMLLALIVYACWKIYRRAQSMPDADKPIYSCLVMAFVGVMVNVQFAGAHIFPLSSLVMALAIGLVFGYRDSSQPPIERPIGPVPIQATLVWGGIMLMMAYLLYAGMELYWLSVDSRLLCMQEAGRAYLYPRFWAQGRLECMQMIAPDHWLFWSWR